MTRPEAGNFSKDIAAAFRGLKSSYGAASTRLEGSRTAPVLIQRADGTRATPADLTVAALQGKGEPTGSVQLVSPGSIEPGTAPFPITNVSTGRPAFDPREPVHTRVPRVASTQPDASAAESVGVKPREIGFLEPIGEETLPDGSTVGYYESTRGGMVAVTRGEGVDAPVVREHIIEGRPVVRIFSGEKLSNVSGSGVNVEAHVRSIETVVIDKGNFTGYSVDDITVANGTANLLDTVGDGKIGGAGASIKARKLTGELTALGPQDAEEAPVVVAIHTIEPDAHLITRGRTTVTVKWRAEGQIIVIDESSINGEPVDTGVYYVQEHSGSESGVIRYADAIAAVRDHHPLDEFLASDPQFGSGEAAAGVVAEGGSDVQVSDRWTPDMPLMHGLDGLSREDMLATFSKRLALRQQIQKAELDAFRMLSPEDRKAELEARRAYAVRTEPSRSGGEVAAAPVVVTEGGSGDDPEPKPGGNPRRKRTTAVAAATLAAAIAVTSLGIPMLKHKIEDNPTVAALKKKLAKDRGEKPGPTQDKEKKPGQEHDAQQVSLTQPMLIDQDESLWESSKDSWQDANGTASVDVYKTDVATILNSVLVGSATPEEGLHATLSPFALQTLNRVIDTDQPTTQQDQDIKRALTSLMDNIPDGTTIDQFINDPARRLKTNTILGMLRMGVDQENSALAQQVSHMVDQKSTPIRYRQVFQSGAVS